MPDTIVRPARPEDLDDLLDMISALGRHHGDGTTANKAQLAADLFSAVPWVFALVAEATSVRVGYTLLGRLYRPQSGERGLEMHNLFVVPQARGRGVGRALMAASVDQARALGCRYLGVGTHPDNVPAQSFYVARGFAPAPPPGPRFRLALA